MLRLLAGAEGAPVSREKFLDVVWGYAAFPTTRTVDNHIASLRAKIEIDPESPRWIKTVHGWAIGWRLSLRESLQVQGRSPKFKAQSSKFKKCRTVTNAGRAACRLAAQKHENETDFPDRGRRAGGAVGRRHPHQ